MSLRIERENTTLVIIDVQGSILSVMYEKETVEERVRILAEGAKTLGLPVLVTQQYTRGLGETTDKIKEALGGADSFEYIEKHTFSVMDEPDFREALKKTGADTVIIAGIETHICVQQSILDMLDAGYKVYVAADCCSSRKKESRDISFRRFEKAGAILTTTETVLFEMLRDSKAPEFRAISKLIK